MSTPSPRFVPFYIYIYIYLLLNSLFLTHTDNRGGNLSEGPKIDVTNILKRLRVVCILFFIYTSFISTNFLNVFLYTYNS